MTTKNFKVKNGIDIGDDITITDAGVITGIDTDNLTEGTNQYYTDARSRAALSAGTGVTYNSGTGAISIGQPVATNSNVQFADVIAGSVQVDNININGNTVISTDTNGSITLDPNGSGNIVLTLANGGNITNNRNYLAGPVRNANTLARGNIWELLSTAGAGTAPYQGVSVDNSADITKQSAVVLRNYGATSGNRGRIIFERSRGTAAAPLRVASGDLLGEFDATGYSETGWLNDQIAAVPAFFGFTATENWLGTSNCGTGFLLSLQPTGTLLAAGAQIPVITLNPTTGIFRTDSYSFRSRAGTTAAGEYLSLGTSGAVIKNGSNTILASFGADNTTIGTTRLRQVTPVSANYGGEISLKAGILNGAGDYDRTTELSVTALTTDGSKSAVYETKSLRFDGTNYSPTQQNDTLGRFTFLGNHGTGTLPESANAAGALQIRAAENFSSTASGTRASLSVNKLGTNNTVDVLDITSTLATIRSDEVSVKNSDNNTDYLNITDTRARFFRPVEFPVYTAATKPASGSMGQQICISDSAQGSNPNGMMAFWDTTNTRWSYIHDNSAV